MHKRLFIILILLTQINLYLTAQKAKPNYRVSFKTGEKITYSLGYSLWLLNTDVGAAHFEVRDTNMNNTPVYHLHGLGRSYMFYDIFFKVRDRYESWINKETLMPLEYNRDVNEGGYIIKVHYQFNRDMNLAYSKWKKTNSPLTYDTLNINTETLDLVSLIYHARNIDYTKMYPGDSLHFEILLDNELQTISYCYQGIELKTAKDMGTFRCFRFTSPIKSRKITEENPEMEFWITADKNLIPIWIEAPVAVGKVRARLVEATGLKYPLSSLIKE